MASKVVFTLTFGDRKKWSRKAVKFVSDKDIALFLKLISDVIVIQLLRTKVHKYFGILGERIKQLEFNKTQKVQHNDR